MRNVADITLDHVMRQEIALKRKVRCEARQMVKTSLGPVAHQDSGNIAASLKAAGLGAKGTKLMAPRAVNMPTLQHARSLSLEVADTDHSATSRFVNIHTLTLTHLLGGAPPSPAPTLCQAHRILPNFLNNSHRSGAA